MWLVPLRRPGLAENRSAASSVKNLSPLAFSQPSAETKRCPPPLGDRKCWMLCVESIPWLFLRRSRRSRPRKKHQQPLVPGRPYCKEGPPAPAGVWVAGGRSDLTSPPPSSSSAASQPRRAGKQTPASGTGHFICDTKAEKIIVGGNKEGLPRMGLQPT